MISIYIRRNSIYEGIIIWRFDCNKKCNLILAPVVKQVAYASPAYTAPIAKTVVASPVVKQIASYASPTPLAYAPAVTKTVYGQSPISFAVPIAKVAGKFFILTIVVSL
jgi:hypothetical protein